MNNFNLKLEIKDSDLTVFLKNGPKILDQASLTISRNLDTLLIALIDKILVKNKIGRLSIKAFKLVGKRDKKAVSGIISKTIETGLNI